MHLPAVRSMALAAVLVGLQIGLVAADECEEAMDQATMNACAEQSFKKADGELNRLYRQIEKRLADDQNTKRLLVAAQRAWIAFRDAECTFSSSGAAEGSIYPMIVTQCRDELTRHRVDDFKSYLSCKEGDLSCPVPAPD